MNSSSRTRDSALGPRNRGLVEGDALNRRNRRWRRRPERREVTTTSTTVLLSLAGARAPVAARTLRPHHGYVLGRVGPTWARPGAGRRRRRETGHPRAKRASAPPPGRTPVGHHRLTPPARPVRVSGPSTWGACAAAPPPRGTPWDEPLTRWRHAAHRIGGSEEFSHAVRLSARGTSGIRRFSGWGGAYTRSSAAPRGGDGDLGSIARSGGGRRQR